MDAATAVIEEVTEVTMKEEEAIVAEATTRDIAAVAVTRTATEEVATEEATVTVVDISHSQVSICVSHLS